MDLNSLWQATLGELELLVSRANFTTWFKNTFASEQKGVELIIGVPNTFTKSWLESKYHAYILKAITSITNGEVKTVSYRVETKKISPQELQQVPQPTNQNHNIVVTTNQPQYQSEYTINPKYTFSSFVVGKTNELAHAAALAVVENPGNAFNPLFLYGGVGLGKTHLIQAIGNEILKRNPDKKVLYTTCESFTRDFVQSIKSGFKDNFLEKYRSADILLIDDIQFIAGKTETQEQFFHVFNTLHQNNRQIVLTADRAPKAIPTLEARLQSRFEWGMIADINPPDLETRVAILEIKMNEKSLILDKIILNHIASVVQTNVRELEGNLNRIIVFHELNHTKPTIDSVKELLAQNQPKPRLSALTSKQLIKTVAEYFEIEIEQLTGQSRKKELVVPRQIVMYLMREEMKASFPYIGNELGNRDHTTVMHAYSKISTSMEIDEKLGQDISLIKQRIYNAV